jgi:protein-tyrosine-phosphatase
VVQWQIPDPSGKRIEEFRRVRDLIKADVAGLLSDLGRLKS